MGNTADSIVLIRELHVLLNGDLCNVVLRKQPSKGVFRKRFWKYAANLQDNTHAKV